MKPLDLTLTISQNIPNFPGSPKPQFIPWSTIREDHYNLELLFLSSHTGTHLDAPYHFVKNGVKIHQIPVKRLIGNAILAKIPKEKNKAITKSDIISISLFKGNNIAFCYCNIFFLGNFCKYSITN